MFRTILRPFLAWPPDWPKSGLGVSDGALQGVPAAPSARKSPEIGGQFWAKLYERPERFSGHFYLNSGRPKVVFGPADQVASEPPRSRLLSTNSPVLELGFGPNALSALRAFP